MADAIEDIQQNLPRQYREVSTRMRARLVGLEDLQCVNWGIQAVTDRYAQLTVSDTTKRLPNLRSKSSLFARQRSEALSVVSIVV
jgi:hypothetical protein